MAADRTTAARIGGQYRARRAFERGEEGASRLRTAQDALGTEAPLSAVYKARQWSVPQLPETSLAHTWESLPDQERANAERALKAATGGDIAYMSRAYGAVLDQRYLEPQRVPASVATPFTEAPTRPSPQRPTRGVVYGAAIRRSGTTAADEAIEAVAPATEKPIKANELLPHIKVSDEDLEQQVPHYRAAAAFAKRQALLERGAVERRI